MSNYSTQNNYLSICEYLHRVLNVSIFIPQPRYFFFNTFIKSVAKYMNTIYL